MKNLSENRQSHGSTQIRTTFMELLGELSSITKDDALVMAAIKDIFSSYKVRFTHNFALVQLVLGHERPRDLRRANLGRRRSA